MHHAIVVAGHAIYQQGDPLDDSSWTLQPYQSGEARFFVEHIERGVHLAALDPAALLIFSGGQTSAPAGPRSEAESYRAVAEHYQWWKHGSVAARTVTEEFARDSAENLQFSLACFHQHIGHWPQSVTLISWQFKEERFQHHCAALPWPAERFTFVGANNPPHVDLAAEARTLAAFQENSPEVEKKRHARNPFLRRHPYLRLGEWPFSTT